MDDRSIVGYTITAGYLFSAALLFYAYFFRRRKHEGMRTDTFNWFWITCATLTLALGINKQLDLQTNLTQWGRQLFRSWELYDARRTYQLYGTLAVIVATLVAGALLLALVRRMGGAFKLVLFGLGLCTTYVLLRLVSFTHVDSFLNLDVGWMRLGWILELSGVACTLIGSVLLFAKPSLESGEFGHKEM